MNKIPTSVVYVVGEVLGLHYFNHRALNSLFLEHGAPGEPPEGNCCEKCQAWLKRCGTDPDVDAVAVLGGVLEAFMDREMTFQRAAWEEGRERILNVLAKEGLSYIRGGHVVGVGTGPATKSLGEILRSRDLTALQVEVDRALQAVDADPPSALTAACSIIEGACKHYLGDEGIPLPREQTAKPLWKAVSEHIGFDPAAVSDDDLKRILGGLSSIVDGLGAFRTHAGSAHGRGRKPYKVAPRHARLAVHAAHTLTLFLWETWEERQAKAGMPAATA